MTDKLIFQDTYAQTTGSVALGFSNHLIGYPAGGYVPSAPLYQMALFGVSVAGSSGNFGLNIMGRCPDGTTMVVAGLTGIGAVKTFIPTNANFTGTTWYTGTPQPYEIQYQRAVGSSISYTALVWGIMYNP